MGGGALRYARTHADPHKHAKQIIDVYNELLIHK